MGVRTTDGEGKVALFDSVSGFAFGPVFDTYEEAISFRDWVEERTGDDIRAASDRDLQQHYQVWSEPTEVAP